MKSEFPEWCVIITKIPLMECLLAMAITDQEVVAQADHDVARFQSKDQQVDTKWQKKQNRLATFRVHKEAFSFY